MNTYAEHKNIKFQADSWERYGHNGLSNKKENCSITLYRILFDFNMKEFEVISNTFTITTGYYLHSDTYSSIDRKDINHVVLRSSKQNVYSWQSWCDKSNIDRICKVIISDVILHRQLLIHRYKTKLAKYTAVKIPTANIKV